MMEIKVFVFNPIQENTYVLWDETKECVIVDAGCSTEKEFQVLDLFIKSNNLNPVKLINTHCHFDHILGVEKCRDIYNITWEIDEREDFLVSAASSQANMFGYSVNDLKPADSHLKEGDQIKVGNSLLTVISVPGHSPGGTCFYEEQSKFVITGDSLFYGSIGRTDLFGGDYDLLISGIKDKLFSLPDDVDVFPGHGPASNIGDEKTTNPYF